MILMFRALVYLITLLICSDTFSQSRTYHSHDVFWGRIVLGDNITSRLRTEVWLQKRTQDTERSTTMFEAPQFNSYWLWFSYNISDNFKIALSPFGYFKSYLLYAEPQDLERPPIKEFRYTLRLEHELKGGFVNFSNRYSFEYRNRDLFSSGTYDPNWRMRYMARFEKPIHAGWLHGRPLSVIAYNEIMVQFGKAVSESPSVFDQNRIYAGFSLSLLKNVKVTPGYLFTIQQRPTGDVFDYINTYWIVLTFDKLISQFKTPREVRQDNQ